MNDDQFWQAVLYQLEGQMSKATFDTYIKDTCIVSRTETRIVIGTPSAFAQEWLEGRLWKDIDRVASSIAGRQIEARFVVISKSEDKDGDPESDFDSVETFNFDPTKRGWVQTSNYSVRFWQPYLNRFSSRVSPFVLWLTLRSFAYDTSKDTWPSINTLAQICGNGDRGYILGRAARPGRNQVVGALEVLENERIVYVKRSGVETKIAYKFRVLDHFPLLTPAQLQKLPNHLRTAHKRWVERSKIDYEEWEQLSIPTLLD